MSFEVFLKIGFFVDNPLSFQALAQVCRNASRACRHLKTLKQYHFQYLYAAYDEYDWKLFEVQSDADEYARSGRTIARRAVATTGKFEDTIVLKLRRIDIMTHVPCAAKCQCPDECWYAFMNK